MHILSGVADAQVATEAFISGKLANFSHLLNRQMIVCLVHGQTWPTQYNHAVPFTHGEQPQKVHVSSLYRNWCKWLEPGVCNISGCLDMSDMLWFGKPKYRKLNSPAHRLNTFRLGWIQHKGSFRLIHIFSKYSANRTLSTAGDGFPSGMIYHWQHLHSPVVKVLP